MVKYPDASMQDIKSVAIQASGVVSRGSRQMGMQVYIHLLVTCRNKAYTVIRYGLWHCFMEAVIEKKFCMNFGSIEN